MGDPTTAGRPRIVQWEGKKPLPQIPNANFAQLYLKELLAHQNEKVALVDASSGRSYSYGDMCSLVPRMSGGLCAAGLSEGDAVLVITKNTIEYPPLAFAIMLAGGTVVPANPLSMPAELAHIARVSKARWMVVQDTSIATVEAMLLLLPPDSFRKTWVLGKDDKRPLVTDLMKTTDGQPQRMANKNFDSSKVLALMPFSSGTTGLPKGVMTTHRNLVTSLMQIKYLLSLEPPEYYTRQQTTLLILPMYHSYALSVVLAGLISGHRIVTMAKFTPKEYLKNIQDYKVTSSPIVPHIVHFLTETKLMQEYDLSSLESFSTGSAPISSSTLLKLMDKTKAAINQGYGLSESSSAVTRMSGTDRFRIEKISSIGKLLPFFEGKIVDTESGETLGDGQIGELCFRSPCIMPGYVDNPEATAATIDPEGWFHTGDLGYFDEHNYFYITDRKKDMIKVKGYQVAPSELEIILREVNGVSDVAVVGEPNERMGEAPKAWVVPAPNAHLDPHFLQEYVKERVVPYKQLAGGVVIVESLPKNQTGKVLKRQLRNDGVQLVKL